MTYLSRNVFAHLPSSNSTEALEGAKTSASKSILFLFTILIIGCLVKQLLKKHHLPYTVVLFVLAVTFGYVTHNSKEVYSYQGITNIPADILMQMFLPILIFESAYTMDSHFFMRSILQCLLLAIPGLVICAILTACYSKTVLASYEWDWKTCFIFGCILSATDPVSVVALLKEIGVSTALTTLIEGESLLNDGAAIVIFDVLFESIKESHGNPSALQFIATFLKIGIGAPIFGYIAGLVTSWALLQINNDAVLEFTVTFCSAFLSYYAAEQLKLSGVLAVVTLGVVVNYRKSSFSPESEEAVHSFWEMMGYLANTLIFTTVGIIIAQRAIKHMFYTDAFLALATYVAVTFFRFAMVLFWSPFLRRMGYGLPWKNAVVLIWGGLRGAIGLALALMLSEENTLDHLVSNQILVQVSMIIILTLVVNGVTMKYLLQLLGLNEIPQSRQVAMAHAVVYLRTVAAKSIKIHKRDKLLGDANWLWVESHTYIIDPYNATDEFDPNCQYTPFKTSLCPKCHENHSVIPSPEEMKEMSEEARCHVLKALKVCYWKYFDRGLICRDSVNILHLVANETIDRPGKYIDTARLKRKYMNVSIVIQKLKNCLTLFGDKLGAESFRAVDVDTIRLYDNTIGFRHWCLGLITSSLWEPVLCLIILTNTIPIIMETNRIKVFQSIDDVCLIYLVIAIIYIWLYTFEAIIKIVGLRWQIYKKNHYNKFALFLIFYGLIDISLDAANHYFSFLTYNFIPLLRLVWLFRLIELYKMFWSLLARFVAWLKDKASSRLYLTYDLGRGYIMAQTEVMEKINYVVDYKPCGNIPLRESEHGILDIMKVLSHMQTKHRGIVIARKSHIAAVGVLNDVKVALNELHERGLLEIVDFDRLQLIIYNLKLKIQNSPKFLSDSKSVHDILRKVDWLTNENLLNIVLKHYVVKDYKAQQSIHEVGQMDSGISIITSGVVKITGTASSEKTERLPNTDSFLYFINKGNFFEYVSTGYTLGLIGSMQNSEMETTAVCETDVQVLHISSATLHKADSSMTEKPPLSYIIWRNISLKIAMPILLDQPHYENNPVEKVNLRLERCILPDFKTAKKFSTDELIEDIVLIQGRVRDVVSGKLYVGPCHISNTIQHMLFQDQPELRPRVVMVIIADESYCLSPEFDWIGSDSYPTQGKLCLLHTIQHRRSTIAERTEAGLEKIEISAITSDPSRKGGFPIKINLTNLRKAKRKSKKSLLPLSSDDNVEN